MDCDGRRFFEAWFFFVSHWKSGSIHRRSPAVANHFAGLFPAKFIEKNKS
jgi:hypothetical protein